MIRRERLADQVVWRRIGVHTGFYLNQLVPVVNDLLTDCFHSQATREGTVAARLHDQRVPLDNRSIEAVMGLEAFNPDGRRRSAEE